MADLIRWDPFRIMRRGDPFSELRQMQRDMDRLFNQFFGREAAAADVTTAGEWMPLVESYMKGDALVLKCELPGVDPKDVDVTFDESANQLVIRGERKQEVRSEDYLYRELVYGKFERRYALPAGVKIDQMKARYTNGILEVTVPAAAAMKPKKIQIETKPEIEAGKKAA